MTRMRVIPRWLVLSILAMLFWGAWGVVPKAMDNRTSEFQKQALSTLGLVPMILVLAFSKNLGAGGRRIRGAAYAFVSGVLTGIGNIAYYRALHDGKASTIVPLTTLYPLITVLLAMIFLREKPNALQVLGIGLALASIYLLNVTEEARFVSEGLVFGLMPIAFWGIAALVQKVSTNYVTNEFSTLWFLAAFVPVALGLLAGVPMEWSLSLKDWLLLVLLGALFGLGNLTLIAAYGSGGKASVVTPLAGLYSIVTVPLAIVLFHDKVGGREWAGIGLALAAVVALSLEKKGEADSSDGNSLLASRRGPGGGRENHATDASRLG